LEIWILDNEVSSRNASHNWARIWIRSLAGEMQFKGKKRIAASFDLAVVRCSTPASYTLLKLSKAERRC
jgi:hypothetical protein